MRSDSTDLDIKQLHVLISNKGFAPRKKYNVWPPSWHFKMYVWTYTLAFYLSPLRHSSWYILWHSIRHTFYHYILASFLSGKLSESLACIHSAWQSIWHRFWHSDMYSEILSDIYSDSLWDMLFYNLSDIGFGILSGKYLACKSIWHRFWHSIWHIWWHSTWHVIWHSFWRLRAGNAHCVREIFRGWGPSEPLGRVKWRVY